MNKKIHFQVSNDMRDLVSVDHSDCGKVVGPFQPHEPKSKQEKRQTGGVFSGAINDVAFTNIAFSLHRRASAHEDAQSRRLRGTESFTALDFADVAPLSYPRCMVMAGDLKALADGLPGTPRLDVAPTADNGWRSEMSLPHGEARRITVEHVIARGDEDIPSARAAARSAALRRLGDADRNHENRRWRSAQQTTRVSACEFLNEKGEPSFAALFVFFKQQAPAAHQGPLAASERLTRIHIYEAFDKDCALGVTTEIYRGAPQETASISRRSSLRRISDGCVMAFAETVLR